MGDALHRRYNHVVVALIAYFVYLKDKESSIAQLFPPSQNPAHKTTIISPYSDNVRAVALVAFAVSGFTALAYEVIWTRQLILFLETSIYAFSGMLAIFLAGIALGSMFMNKGNRPTYTTLAFFRGSGVGRRSSFRN